MSVEIRQGGIVLRCDCVYPPHEDPWGGGRCPGWVYISGPRCPEPSIAADTVRLFANVEHGWRHDRDGDRCPTCLRRMNLTPTVIGVDVECR